MEELENFLAELEYNHIDYETKEKFKKLSARCSMNNQLEMTISKEHQFQLIRAEDAIKAFWTTNKIILPEHVEVLQQLVRGEFTGDVGIIKDLPDDTGLPTTTDVDYNSMIGLRPPEKIQQDIQAEYGYHGSAEWLFD